MRSPDALADGELSDMESDPTSVISVPANLWKNGRPLAAAGLTIKTRKPRFTTLTMITTSPRNPLVEIRFNREGKPVSVRFLRSSGSDDVDGPIADAIAAWRASGKPLEALKGDATVVIRMKLVLIQ